MKKVISVIMASVLMLCFVTACGGDTSAKGPDGTLTEIVEKIYESSKPEFGVMTMEVNVSDSDALKAYTGLDSADKVSEAVASEPMIGSQAYSLVLVRVKNSADAKEVAEAMKNGINQAKWICVEADQIRVSACGDVVMLIMMSSNFNSETLSVDKITDAFKALCGGTLTVDLK